MSDEKKPDDQLQKSKVERRGFLSSALGGILAAIAGWAASTISRDWVFEPEVQNLFTLEERISALQAQITALEEQIANACSCQEFAQLEGENNQRIIFNKSELSIINPSGVLLNLVATHGHVGIRFYKDFYFENEQETNPWHMGYIEGQEGYEGLAILRDWKFTAALWDADGKLKVGRLRSHPPANTPANARLHVSGNSYPDEGPMDEVLTIIEGSPIQSEDILQVISSDGAPYFSVDGTGNVHIGSQGNPKDIIFHDTLDGRTYALKVTGGSLVLEEG